ncbi:hypothetical protein RRG08_015369 [Elysia crispata]|uniref:Uncharacterized protein n=1 Tax=Elysia crispata TaxID=231223 RepID=A0AAE1A8Q3_9GAST|nr:hypothetical protein RRG08_015369 [Elysia crispata]
MEESERKIDEERSTAMQDSGDVAQSQVNERCRRSLDLSCLTRFCESETNDIRVPPTLWFSTVRPAHRTFFVIPFPRKAITHLSRFPKSTAGRRHNLSSWQLLIDLYPKSERHTLHDRPTRRQMLHDNTSCKERATAQWVERGGVAMEM